MFCTFYSKSTNYDDGGCNDNHDSDFDENNDQNFEKIFTQGFLKHRKDCHESRFSIVSRFAQPAAAGLRGNGERMRKWRENEKI